MKKKLMAVALLLLISVSSTFVNGDDGTTHSGGKSCPTNQTCLTETQEHQDTKQSDDFFKKILIYLKNLFG